MGERAAGSVLDASEGRWEAVPADSPWSAASTADANGPLSTVLVWPRVDVVDPMLPLLLGLGLVAIALTLRSRPIALSMPTAVRVPLAA